MAGCNSGLPSFGVSINPTCDADSLTPAQFVNCVLNQSQGYASEWANRATEISSTAICDARGADWDISRDEDPYTVTAEEPLIPDDIDNAVTIYDSQVQVMIPLFTDNFDDYLNRDDVAIYNPAYQAAAAWLVDVIQNGVSGIPETLENQIYGRAEDRIRAEAAIARQNALDEFNSRGWRMPQPAALAIAKTAENAAYRSLGEVSVKLAEKQVEIQIDSIKFAVEEANKIFLGMHQNAINYISALIRALNQSLELARVDPNVRANFINATANLFGQRINKDRVQFMALNDYYQRMLEDNRLKSSNEIGKNDLVVKAGMSASDVSKMLAAAALSQFSGLMSNVVSG